MQTNTELQYDEATIKLIVETQLPELASNIRKAKELDAVLLLPHSSFGQDQSEIKLLSLFVAYAEMLNVDIFFTSKHETERSTTNP